MPLDYKVCPTEGCGRVYYDWRRKTCRQCRIRQQYCEAVECGRPHRSEYRYCSSCRRARRHITKPRLDNLPRARAAQERWNARRDWLERTRDRDDDPYDGPRSARARAGRLADQRQQGIRICANTHCRREHRDQTAAVCRQCRLEWHESCAECRKPFKGEWKDKTCATCRSRQKRARRRAKVELSYFDAIGDLDSASSDVV